LGKRGIRVTNQHKKNDRATSTYFPKLGHKSFTLFEGAILIGFLEHTAWLPCGHTYLGTLKNHFNCLQSVQNMIDISELIKELYSAKISKMVYNYKEKFFITTDFSWTRIPTRYSRESLYLCTAKTNCSSDPPGPRLHSIWWFQSFCRRRLYSPNLKFWWHLWAN